MIRLLAMVLLVFVVGCESASIMHKSQKTLTATPAATHAHVIFVRSSLVASGLGAPLYEVSGENIRFIGVIENDTKITHTTTPGKHTFMVVSETVDFIEADLIAGRSYYGVVVPKMGVWKARFSLWPVRRDDKAEYSINSPSVQSWLTASKPVTGSDSAQEWHKQNEQGVQEKFRQNWPEWRAKDAQARAQKSLTPDDGI